MSKPKFSANQLADPRFEDVNSADILRYFIQKISKNELKKLKIFEKEYLIILMKNIVKDEIQNELNPPDYILANKFKYLAFNPYDYKELDEATFNHLVLFYYDNLDFLMPISFTYNGITRQYTREEIDLDRNKFNQLLFWWKEQLSVGNKSSPLLKEIKDEYHKKVEILKEYFNQRSFGYNLFKRNVLKWECLMFYIYFIIKKYLQSRDVKELCEVVNNKYIITNYSFVHILSRHYFADFNTIYFNKTVIRDETLFDPWNLPQGVKIIIELFEEHRPNWDTEKDHLFFRYNLTTYILYFKEKFVDKLGHKLKEIRTLYPVSTESDNKKLTILKTQKKIIDYVFFMIKIRFLSL
ncbi:hypothetical protein FYC62_04030 [Pedobacter aquae]|uniref:Uncharacterized protein n=1 Tax=Pedobacter aquae TaxID=2605747 RepID=A0A5C0VGB2_9SPHI|nr:hypothetical protein [Pedobacter aquae]QEK50932.1 hypothetical protein FYC62_04030 [Pedobacter aquae]